MIEKIADALRSAISIGDHWGFWLGIIVFIFLLFIKFSSQGENSHLQHMPDKQKAKFERMNENAHFIGCLLSVLISIILIIWGVYSFITN